MSRHVIARPPAHPLLLGICPRPQPDIAPVTLAWTNSHLLGLMHPGITAQEITRTMLQVCPDPVAQQWIFHFGLHAPIDRVRQRLEEYLPAYAHLDARWEHLPPHARVQV